MKIAKNYIYNLSYQILVMILPIVMTPYIARVLGVEGVGAYSVSVSVSHYFVLLGMLGVHTYGNRQIAYDRDNPEKLAQTFWEICVLKACTMGLSILMYVLMVCFVIPEESKALYGVQIITLLASLVDISWFFAGMEQFRKTAIRNILVKLGGAVLIFMFVKTQEDVALYSIILAGATLLGQCVLWPALPKYMRHFCVDFSNIKRHLSRTVALWLPTIAIQVYTSLDKVMLGYMAGNAEAGLYESSQKIVTIASMITTSLSTVMIPRMANLFQNGKMDAFKRYGEQAFHFVSFIAVPLCFGIMGIRETLVPWFYGEGYEAVSGLLMISAWLVITLGWSNVFGHVVLVATKHEKQFTIAVTCGAVINVILNVVFITRYKAAGALAASVIAEYTGMFIMMYHSRTLVDIRRLFKGVARYFAVGAVMFIGIDAMGKVLPGTILSTLLQVIAGAAFYLVVMYFMKDPSMQYLKGILQRKLKIKAVR